MNDWGWAKQIAHNLRSSKRKQKKEREREKKKGHNQDPTKVKMKKKPKNEQKGNKKKQSKKKKQNKKEENRNNSGDRREKHKWNNKSKIATTIDDSDLDTVDTDDESGDSRPRWATQKEEIEALETFTIATGKQGDLELDKNAPPMAQDTTEENVDRWDKLMGNAKLRELRRDTQLKHDRDRREFREKAMKQTRIRNQVDPQVNEPWGNDLANKNENNMRLMGVNINTLTMEKSDVEYVMRTFYNFEATVIGIMETNADCNNYNVRELVREVANETWGYHRAQLASNKHEKPKETHLPGGTLVMACAEDGRRAIEQGMDETGLGRWSWIRMVSSALKRITYVTAYRPCPNTVSTAGETTSWMQQFEHYRKRGVKIPNPREKMLEDLRQFVFKESRMGNEVVIMMDANESLSEKKGLYNFALECKIQCAHRCLHPDLIEPKTGIKGRKQIDYIFVTEGLLPHIEAAGWLKFNHGLLTDHRI